MSNLGFDVSDLAPSPNRAFSLAMSHKPDIVLMDTLDSVWVIVARDENNRHLRVPGAPVLPKPVYREGLADAVAEAIEHRIG
jgi:hypothetical protein